MVALGYLWKVAVNLLILFIVAWALEKLHGRTESLIISVLGMIYVTIRTTLGYLGLGMMEVAISQQEQLVAIRSWIDGTYIAGDFTADIALIKRTRTKFYIDGLFLFIISLLCMATFFTHL